MDDIASALTGFLHGVDKLAGGVRPGYANVAFPAGSALIVGSPIGREIWESPEAHLLTSTLLAADPLSAWFKPPPSPEFVELQLQIASIVDVWARSGESPEDFVTRRIVAIMKSLTDPTPVCHGVMIAQGVTIGDAVVLPEGLRIVPAAAEEMRNLPTHYPVRDREIYRLPDRPTVFATCSLRSDRNVWTSIAATTAFAWCRMRLHSLREAIWLATGTVPVFCEEFYWHESEYPPGLFEHFSAPPERRFSKIRHYNEIKASTITDVYLRRWAFFGIEEHPFEDATWLALWMVDSYVHAVLSEPDPLFCTLMAYAAFDGLMRNVKENDSIIGPRIAALIGRDDADSRFIRQFLHKVRDVRGVAAHGRRPLLKDVASTYGRTLTDEDIEANPITIREEIYEELKDTILGTLRRTILAYLWLAVKDAAWDDKTQSPTIEAGLTRAEILQLADSACRNDAEAVGELARLVPEFARQVA